MTNLQIFASHWGEVSQGCGYLNPSAAIDKETSPAGSCSTVQNATGTCSNLRHKLDTVCSGPVRTPDAQISELLKCCLTLETAEAWSAFSHVAASRLSETKRAGLAYAALNSLSAPHARMAAAASMCSAGAPPPPFLGGMDEARFWASIADRFELKAFALAAYEAMNSADKEAFTKHISKKENAP